MIYLDTHVLVWLYASGKRQFPNQVIEIIEANDDIRISPVVRLELQYLFEIERINEPALQVVDALEASIDLHICSASFAAVIKEAEGHNWTRDPFDRMIVAQASLFDAPLITKDTIIHQHYANAVW